MYDLACRIRKAKNKVMVLTAVVFASESTDLVQKRSLEYRKMANIVVRKKIVYRKVGFEMICDNVVEILSDKSCLIGINILCTLLAYSFHSLKQSGGMKHVVVVKKSDILSACHLNTSVGVFGNTLVLFKLFINNSAVVLCKTLAILADKSVFVVAAVRKTKFPIFIGLICNRLYHFNKELLGCVVQRN